MEGKSDKQGRERELKQSAEQSQPEEARFLPTEPQHGEITAQPSRNDPEKRCWRDKRWRHPQVIVNGLLAFIAVIAGVIYFGQLQEMKRATKAAERAANLANKSIKQVEANERLDQRAWITVRAAVLDNQLAAGQKPSVT